MINKQTMGGNQTFGRFGGTGAGGLPPLPLVFVGTYFTTTIKADGSIQVAQTAISNGGDFASHPALRLQRTFNLPGSVAALVGEWVTVHSADANTENGGDRIQHVTENNVGTRNVWGLDDNNTSVPTTPFYYVPGFGAVVTDYITYSKQQQRNRFNGYTSHWRDSDGVHARQVLFPNDATARVLISDSQALYPGIAYANGVTVRWQFEGPKPNDLDPGAAIAGIDRVCDDTSQFGANAAAGHLSLWGATVAAGVVQVLEIRPSTAALSTAGRAAFSFAANRLTLSNNAGAYSAVATLADVTGGITQLTDDVTAGPGTGSQAATVANVPAAATRAWTTDTAGGDIQNLPTTLVMSGTNGDYDFEADIIVANAADDLVFQFNTVSTDQESVGIGGDGDITGGTWTAHIFQFDDRTWIIDATAGTEVVHIANGRIRQITGEFRQIEFDMYINIDGADLRAIFHVSGLWKVTTAITAFRIHSTSADGIGNGSVLRMRRA